jgi:hypothetical protein
MNVDAERVAFEEKQSVPEMTVENSQTAIFGDMNSDPDQGMPAKKISNDGVQNGEPASQYLISKMTQDIFPKSMQQPRPSAAKSPSNQTADWVYMNAALERGVGEKEIPSPEESVARDQISNSVDENADLNQGESVQKEELSSGPSFSQKANVENKKDDPATTGGQDVQ